MAEVERYSCACASACHASVPSPDVPASCLRLCCMCTPQHPHGARGTLPQSCCVVCVPTPHPTPTQGCGAGPTWRSSTSGGKSVMSQPGSTRASLRCVLSTALSRECTHASLSPPCCDSMLCLPVLPPAHVSLPDHLDDTARVSCCCFADSVYVCLWLSLPAGHACLCCTAVGHLQDS